MTASSDQNPALTVDFAGDRLVGTVRGQALVRVQAQDSEADAILRLRRFLPRVSLLRYRDLSRDGSPIGSERDAAILPNDDPRLLDCALDLPPGAVAREYRLEWELNPDDHPAIGKDGHEMLLFRAFLLTRDEDGAERIREQRPIVIRWREADALSCQEADALFSSFRRWSTSPSTPEPLREALQALLREEAESPPSCELCRARSDLDLLLAQDRVWECSAAPELQEVRRLFVRRELAGNSDGDRIARYRMHHDHEDVSAPLAAARERREARLLAYAPAAGLDAPPSGGKPPAEDGR